MTERRATEAVESKGAEPKRSRRVFWLSLLGVVLVVGVGVGAWYGLPVRSITVEGNRIVSAARTAELAGVAKEFGWLYYGAWRARALERHPWVRSVSIRKVWPDRVEIRVVERTPAVTLVREGRQVVLDWDGTVLPGATPRGPVITGWGPDRSREAMEAARLLERFGVQAVEYTPSGLTVVTNRGTAWSGSLVSLQKYGSGVTMYAGKRVSIYPWGVSVGE